MNTLSQFMVEPRKVHWVAAKHVLRYLARIVEYALDYRRSDGIMLIGFTDSDWASNVANRKSTSKCCFSLDLAVVSCFRQKQKCVALSSAKVEYMVASQDSCEALWLRKLLVDLFDPYLPDLESTINQQGKRAKSLNRIGKKSANTKN